MTPQSTLSAHCSIGRCEGASLLSSVSALRRMTSWPASAPLVGQDRARGQIEDEVGDVGAVRQREAQLVEPVRRHVCLPSQAQVC